MEKCSTPTWMTVGSFAYVFHWFLCSLHCTASCGAFSDLLNWHYVDKILILFDVGKKEGRKKSNPLKFYVGVGKVIRGVSLALLLW